jgi:hypothetical protein
MLSSATKIDSHRARRNLLRAVASLELIKGILVLLIGLCAILLVRKDAWVMAESLLALFHISTDRHAAQVFLDFADNLTDTRLWAAARLALVYSVLLLFFSHSRSDNSCAASLWCAQWYLQSILESFSICCSYCAPAVASGGSNG